MLIFLSRRWWSYYIESVIPLLIRNLGSWVSSVLGLMIGRRNRYVLDPPGAERPNDDREAG